jgi:hypothetical protein
MVKMLYTFHGFKFLVDPFTEPSRSSAQSKQLFAILHLSTYIMETRRKKKSTDVANEEEEPKNEKLTKKI